MNPEPPFNLNTAVHAWRKELEAAPGLAAEARSELEAHVRDSVAELRVRGLDDEEAFWLARRRVGRPPELAQEFCKSDPQERARQQALWVATGMLGLYFWGWVSSPIRLFAFRNHQTVLAILSNLLWIVPVALMIYWARNGSDRWWRPHSRRQFVILATLAAIALQALDISMWPAFGRPIGLVKPSINLLTVNILWPAALIALVAWLMPASAKAAQKAA